LLLLQDIEEEQVMVARMLHQLTCDDLRLQFAILRAARGHLELGGPARMRHTLPALAFCALKALRRLEPEQQQQDTAADGAAAAAAAAGAAAAVEAVTAESALQWLLEVALQLAEVPAPMPALRLLLVCAHISSEEAGLEMLAYEFFEQVGAYGLCGCGCGAASSSQQRCVSWRVSGTAWCRAVLTPATCRIVAQPFATVTSSVDTLCLLCSAVLCVL
jgi:hypothetical protein